MRRPLPLDRLQGIVPPDRGLTTAEAADRLRRYGPNRILEVPGHPFLDLAADTAKDPMIWFLIGIAVVYAALGEAAEAVTLLVAIVPLVGMDAWLHRRTRASTEGLRSRLATTARVSRDGRWTEIPAEGVVPGDLVRVGASEYIPADGRFLEGRDLQADESTLTGEAYPVRKRAAVDWALAGTRVLTGEGAFRVAFTGRETLYGEIVQSAVHGSKERTPLQVAISGLVTLLVIGAIAMCAVLAFVRIHQGYSWIDALVSAATLAVAALPEEFPVVFAIFLGVGVYRLAKRQALVRRAVSVENIGRVSCICSDKTGTITEGKLALTHLLARAGTTEEELLRSAAAASRGESGDPLDAAVLAAAEAKGVREPDLEVLGTFPFTEDRRRESAVVRRGGDLFAVMKGSTEVVLDRCALEGGERAYWEQEMVRLASEGHKVIGVARRVLAAWDGGEPDRKFEFAGLLALEDPVRAGVTEAVRECREAGIHVVMLTGDHPSTAEAVAREIGLGGGAPRVAEADHLPADLRGIDVIARAIPSQKLEIVRSLKERGEIVAVTGDGVNDVPALQAADIGVAMGERGTRAAREVASIVLLDDNFSSIVAAIAEGRQLFENLKASFHYLLTIHIPLVVTAAVIPLAGYPLLYLPVHIIWLEAIIHPTALLVFQEMPARGLAPRPRFSRRASFFSGREWTVLSLSGVLITVLIVLRYHDSLGPARDVPHARAVALAILTLASAALTGFLSRFRTKISVAIALLTVTVSSLLIQVPWFATHLHLEPLHARDWVLALAIAAGAVGLPMLFSEPRGRKGSCAA
jgi:Ca2+-transporting ATPase